MENQELNIEKILEVTNKYFKGNKEVNLTDLQMELLRNVAEYDDATNNLIKWLNDEIENDEERSIENYLAEVTNVYEMMKSLDDDFRDLLKGAGVSLSGLFLLLKEELDHDE